MSRSTVSSGDFIKALEIGRPANIKQLFPNSKALIVSGKVIDRAMIAKGKAIAIAANGRNQFVIRGALLAAQRANSAVIIEIAKSEGGTKAYCAVNYWNMAMQVDAICNELGITVPVAVHADHYGIKNDKDLTAAKVEIPTLFEAGMTSIAIDASHLVDDKNLLANLTPQHPQIRDLDQRIASLRESLDARLRAMREALIRELRAKSQTLDSRAAELQRQIQSVRQDQRGLPDLSRRYAQLQRELALNETLQSTLRAKLLGHVRALLRSDAV